MEKSIEVLKEEANKGIITNEYIDFLKDLYIHEILRAETPKSANALVAYAHFLNNYKINSDNYPLYLAVLSSNNKYAIDQLLEGYEKEKYLDCVLPNNFLVKQIFSILKSNKCNELYQSVIEVFLGFLIKVYISAEEGYQLYQPTIADVNNLAKFLDEDKDQDDEINRLVLDVLLFFTDLDHHSETEEQKKEIARHSGRIRSDFFDNKRSLIQSLTDVILDKIENPEYGLNPEYIYG